MTDHPFTNKHCYALINPAPTPNRIVRTTGELDAAPPNEPPFFWVQVVDDSPRFNPDTHERHSPKITMRNDGRCYREFQIRPKK